MANAESIQIADAVVTALNGHTFDAPYDSALGATRLYVPVYNLTDLNSLKVTVVAASWAGAPASRARAREMNYEIDVGVQKKVGAPADAAANVGAVNDLMRLCEEVADFLFQSTELTGTPNQTVPIGVSNEPIYDPRRLDEYGEFLSVITMTYRVYR